MNYKRQVKLISLTLFIIVFFSSMISSASKKLPEKIRVLKTDENEIVEIDFKEYCKNVLPNEWYASWDMDSLKAGAMAVKTYAWYWIIHDKYSGNYDVKATVGDQVYEPNTEHPRTNKAVEETWDYIMTKNGKIFQSQYDSGKEREVKPLNSGRLSQWGTQYLASERNKAWKEILHYYYDPIEISPLKLNSRKITPQIQCDKCGEGWFNFCDKSECNSLGRCWWKENFFSFLGTGECWSCDRGIDPIKTCGDYTRDYNCKEDRCKIGDCIWIDKASGYCVKREVYREFKDIFSDLHLAFHPTCKEGKKIVYEIGESLKRELEGVVKDFKMRNKIECEFKQDGTPKDFPFWIGKPEENYLTISLKQSELNKIFYIKGSEYGKKLAALLTGELKSKKFSVKPKPVQCPEYTDLCENSYGSTPVSIRVEFDEKDKDRLVEAIKKTLADYSS